MHVTDDLYTGPTGPNGFVLYSTIAGESTTMPQSNPSRQYGVGPLGRVVFRDITPKALATANLAVLQAPASGVPLTLVVGAGLTTNTAPDGSGSNIYMFDVPRCVSLTSTANLSAINFLVTMYDEYGRLQTQLMAGPNNNTVTSLKAALAVLSIVPQGSSASQLSAGTSDIFGLQFKMPDAGYIISAKWANVLAQNAGTFTVADTTSPATNLTGDPRGTYAQSGAASNGVNKLVICMHVDATQCGPNATQANAIGVTPA